MKENLKTKILNSIRIIGILALAVNFSACAALTSSRQNISITTNVADASITVNGENKGVGSTSYSVKRNQNLSIMAVKEGYKPAFKTVNKRYNAGGILDLVLCVGGGIILTFPWCISGIAAPGAWSLYETNILLEMTPDNSYKTQASLEQSEEAQNENPAI